MKLLVTGGAGYIGSHIVNYLLKQRISVVILDNLSTGFAEALPSSVDFVQGDIRDRVLLEKVFNRHKFDYVIHLAALSVVSESVNHPDLYYDNNINGTLALALACAHAKVKGVIFSSTAAVYGNSSSDEHAFTEDSPLAPLNPYGNSKLVGEMMLRDIGTKAGFSTVSLRYFNVAGAASDGSAGERTEPATHLVKVASQVACGKRSKIFIHGDNYNTPDGTCIRDYIHVEDLSEIHLITLEYLSAGGKSDIFNCGYGNGYSVREVLNKMREVSGIKFSEEIHARRSGDPDQLVSSPAKLMKNLSWKPKHASLDQICLSAFEWEKKLGTSRS